MTSYGPAQEDIKDASGGICLGGITYSKYNHLFLASQSEHKIWAGRQKARAWLPEVLHSHQEASETPESLAQFHRRSQRASFTASGLQPDWWSAVGVWEQSRELGSLNVLQWPSWNGCFTGVRCSALLSPSPPKLSESFKIHCFCIRP